MCELSADGMEVTWSFSGLPITACEPWPALTALPVYRQSTRNLHIVADAGTYPDRHSAAEFLSDLVEFRGPHRTVCVRHNPQRSVAIYTASSAAIVRPMSRLAMTE